MSANPVAPLVGGLFGPFYVGAILSSVFYGITCMQIFFYYVHYQKDSLRIKILVAILWVIDTIHEALCIFGAYQLAIAGLVDPFSFVSAMSGIISTYLVTLLVAIPTQGFLVYRIYIFSKKNVVPVLVCAILALVQLVCGAMYVGKAVYVANQIHNSGIILVNTGIFATLGTVSLSAGAAVDVLVAIGMTFLIVRERNHTYFAKTTHILQRLIVFAVNTGTWTATFALLTAIILHLFPTKVFHAVFVLPLGSLYCNTLLANLNGRSYVRGPGWDNNISLDLVACPSSGMSNSAEGDGRRGEPKLATSSHETAKVTFANANRSSTDVAKNV